MTVLTIVGLFTAVGLFPYYASNDQLINKIRSLEIENHAAKKTVEVKIQQIENLNEELQDAVENEKMFDAIQEAQKIINEFSSESGLEFNEDQSLQFGDDLVSFDINSVEPIWNHDGRERLWEFCKKLSQQMARTSVNKLPINELLTVQVEGHTDETSCQYDTDCNWSFSSDRSASFVAMMRDPAYCLGGDEWDLRSIGYADKRPLLIDGKRVAVRRITVRLVPNYGAIIDSNKAKL